MTSSDYYVYIYFRSNGHPCYVGKGKGDRWEVHEKYKTNEHLWRIIQKAQGSLPRLKVQEGLTNEEAKIAERAFIKALGREDLGTGCLVNLTDGGEGENPGPAQREAFRQAKLTPESLARLAAARSKVGPETPERSERRRAGQARRRENDAEARSIVSKKMSGIPRSLQAIENQRKEIAMRPPEVEAARCEKIRVRALAQWEARRAAGAGASV